MDLNYIMENVFAKPPPSIPQHYKLLLEKKEATFASSNDCFAPASLSPSHLYTPNGILLGQRKSLSKISASSYRRNSELSGANPSFASKESKDIEFYQKELDKSRKENKVLQERILKLETLLNYHSIEF